MAETLGQVVTVDGGATRRARREAEGGVDYGL
jgi:hypothetical protein